MPPSGPPRVAIGGPPRSGGAGRPAVRAKWAAAAAAAAATTAGDRPGPSPGPPRGPAAAMPRPPPGAPRSCPPGAKGAAAVPLPTSVRREHHQMGHRRRGRCGEPAAATATPDAYGRVGGGEEDDGVEFPILGTAPRCTSADGASEVDMAATRLSDVTTITARRMLSPISAGPQKKAPAMEPDGRPATRVRSSASMSGRPSVVTSFLVGHARVKNAPRRRERKRWRETGVERRMGRPSSCVTHASSAAVGASRTSPRSADAPPGCPGGLPARRGRT